jgi:hypothetical protein
VPPEQVDAATVLYVHPGAEHFACLLRDEEYNDVTAF